MIRISSPLQFVHHSNQEVCFAEVNSDDAFRSVLQPLTSSLACAYDHPAHINCRWSCKLNVMVSCLCTYGACRETNVSESFASRMTADWPIYTTTTPQPEETGVTEPNGGHTAMCGCKPPGGRLQGSEYVYVCF